MIYVDSAVLEQIILDLLNKCDGMTDQQLKDMVPGRCMAIHTITNICRQLEYKGKLIRLRNSGKMPTNHLILPQKIDPNI